MIWLLVAIGALVGALLAVRAWSRWSAAREARPARRRSGSVFATERSEIDDEYRHAIRPWPVLQGMFLFWVAAGLSLIMIAFDIKFGVSRGMGDPGRTMLYVMMFIACDVLLPVVTLMSDRGNTDQWWRDRAVGAWAAIVICTVINIGIVIGSTGEVATTTSAQANIAKLGYEQRAAQLTSLQREHDAIPQEAQAPAALQKLADETAAAADREGERGGCATKCEALKKQARELAARAANAKRKDALRAQIAAARADLEGNAPTARTQGDTLGSSVEDFTGGIVPAAGVNKHIMTVFGLAVALLATIVWARVSDVYQTEMARVRERASEIADEKLTSRGYPPRYTAQMPETQALPAPPPGDTIVVNVQAEDMRRRYANDPDLLETDGLFGTLLVADEEGVVARGALYKAYRVAVLRQDPNRAQCMTEATLMRKLETISQHRDDVMFAADGRVIGWRLRTAEDVAKDAAAAA